MTQYRLTRRVLCAAVTCLAPASRALAPSVNKLIASGGWRTQSRFPLELATQEGRKAAQGWYEYQGSNTRFTSLEYRKDKKGHFKHEFIVVRLNETTVCRFDRRAQYELRGHALKDEGTVAEDSAHVLCSFETEYRDLIEQSEVLLKISFPEGEDLKFLIAICFGIQTHPRAGSYSLLMFNCYFFSWTMVTAVTRRALQWENVGENIAIRNELATVFNNQTTASRQTTSHVPQPAANKSMRTQLISWLKAPLRPLAFRGLRKSRDSEVRDFWKKMGTRLIQDPSLKLQSYLQKVLLRSQLQSMLVEGIVELVKSACANEVASLVGPLVKKACEPWSRCSFPVPAPPNPYVRELGFLAQNLSLQEPESLLDISPRGTLIEHVCSEATKMLLPKCSKHEHEVGSSSQPYNGCASLLDCLHDWDAAWSDVREHYVAEYNGWFPPPTPRASSIFSPRLRLAYGEAEFNAQVQHLDEGDAKGKAVWRNTWDKYYFEGGEKCCAFIADCISTVLLEHLTDINPERLEFGENSKRKWLARSKKILRDAAGLSQDPPLQEYIRGRMQDHFEMVDRVGFGTFEELLDRAEKAMCKIWLATIEVLEHPISGWTAESHPNTVPSLESYAVDIPHDLSTSGANTCSQ